MKKTIFLSGLIVTGLFALPAQAGDVISNDMSKCDAGQGPSVLVIVRGVRANNGKKLDGKVRVQTYNGTKQDWLKRGRWLSRVESLPIPGTMRFCMPVPKPGNYAVAVRHDINGNGKTDINNDGGGFSNNPKLSNFRVITGRTAVKLSSAQFHIGTDVKQIVIDMKYR